MPQEQDHYRALGVAPTATQDDIKKAWRKGIITHHPDRGGERARFDAVQEAWECLGDPAARASYDRRRNAPPPTAGVHDRFTPPPAAGGYGGPTSPRPEYPPFAGAGDRGVEDAVFEVPFAGGQDFSSSLLYSFADGEEVEITSRNRHGALIPDEHQRVRYRMGPRFIYRQMRARDAVFRVAPPRREPEESLAGLLGSAAVWTLWSGPAWFRPKFRWLASTVLVLAVFVGLLVGAAAGFTGDHQLGALAALGVSLWWPVPRLLCLLWARTPALPASAFTGGVAGVLAAGAASAGAVGVVVGVAVGAAAGVGVRAAARSVGRRVVARLPRFLSERLVVFGAGGFSGSGR